MGMVQGNHNGTCYRLIVTVADRDVIYDAPPFHAFKPAMAHVAHAVRQHARHGEVQAITLQRTNGTNGTSVHAALASETGAHEGTATTWVTVASWNTPVIQRILLQARHDLPAAMPAPPAAPVLRIAGGATGAAPEPDDDLGTSDLRPPHSASRHLSGRWHWIATGALMIFTWAVTALISTGGHPLRWFEALRTAPPAMATEIPFAARAERATLPPAAQRATPDSRPAAVLQPTGPASRPTATSPATHSRDRARTE